MDRAPLIAIAATGATIIVFVLAILVIDGAREDVIGDGVRIGALDVSGLDRDEARSLVRRKLSGAVDRPVTARYHGRRFVLRPDAAKPRLDVDATVDAALRRGRGADPFSRVLGGMGDARGAVTPRVEYSEPAVAGFVARVAARVDRGARDADIDWHDGKLERTHAKNGVQVRRPQLVAALAGHMASPPGKRSVDVPVKVIERPDRTLADLAKRYPTVIAVDRDGKTLRLYERLKLTKRYAIAVGQAGLETAAGRYKIQEKVVNPPWHVPNSDWAGELAGRTIPPGDPQNPLEARWMGFFDGQGIHGTTDLASLGTAASHGCIRMSVPAVKELYDEVKIGTPLFLQ